MIYDEKNRCSVNHNVLVSAKIGNTAIVGLSLEELEKLVASLGHPRYRAKQLYHWVYQKSAASLEQMANLPNQLLKTLGTVRFSPLEVVTKRTSVDGTVKLLFRTLDGQLVETVMIPDGDRTTVCVSSQVGCAMGCTFCATGQQGFTRNLSAQEIVGQILSVQQLEGNRVTNVVYMGMGEPLLNYDEVIKSIKIINDEQGLNIGIRHLTVSTCGIVPGILRLADEGLQLVLAVSLHSADELQRAEMMPVSRAYPLSTLMSACQQYWEKTGRRVTFEYALIAGVNDSRESAEQLVELVSQLQCHINLIPINPVANTGFERSQEQSVRRFAQKLERAGVSATVRKERGTDIEAACGQLKGKVEKR